MPDEQRKKPNKSSSGRKDGKKTKKPGLGMNAALVLLLAVVIVGALLAAGYFLTTVRSITVSGNSILTDDQVKNLAGLYTGRSIFAYDLNAAKRGIETDPYLKCETIKRVYPNKLMIIVSERKEFAALLMASSTYAVIDSSGCVLDIGRSEESVEGLLPVYGLASMSLTVGRRINEDGGKLRPYTVMSIIESLGDRWDEISLIDISNVSSVRLVTAEGITVMLGDSVNIPSKIERMFRAIPKVDPQKAGIAVIYVNSSGTTDLSYPTPKPTEAPVETPEPTGEQP